MAAGRTLPQREQSRAFAGDVYTYSEQKDQDLINSSILDLIDEVGDTGGDNEALIAALDEVVKIIIASGNQGDLPDGAIDKKAYLAVLEQLKEIALATGNEKGIQNVLDSIKKIHEILN